MSYKDYISENSVILIGNGINRINTVDKYITWEEILKSLKNNSMEDNLPKGYPLTEYFEIINIDRNDITAMKTDFINKINKMEPNKIHYDVVKFCKEKGINILTTNFDHSLQKTEEFKKGAERNLMKGFTNFYPWQRYYEIAKSIKIWHINGDNKYTNSIKLSVKDYSGCINYYKRFDPLVKNTKYKKDRTWINEIMENDLLIIGLTLSEAEFFIRHILIQRHSYLKKNNKKLKGYYFSRKSENQTETEKLEFFLKSVGIEIITYESYNEIYY